MRTRDLTDDLKAAGFSTRTVHGLIYGAGIASIEHLRSAPWGSLAERQGLVWELHCSPNMGAKGLAEVEAFRRGEDPRKAKPPGPERVSVPFEPDQIAALDAWIAKQPKPVSRHEAIRAFVAAGLQLLGDQA